MVVVCCCSAKLPFLAFSINIHFMCYHLIFQTNLCWLVIFNPIDLYITNIDIFHHHDQVKILVMLDALLLLRPEISLDVLPFLDWDTMIGYHPCLFYAIFILHHSNPLWIRLFIAFKFSFLNQVAL
jgi:hypothetical protein